mmetsp:Transcript_15451/g.27950  ORF Transcript_15451/g.27950 Transcript_15451/m.27950 type:complete len:127 (-) Transcript_15451:438-818(-)
MTAAPGQENTSAKTRATGTCHTLRDVYPPQSNKLIIWLAFLEYTIHQFVHSSCVKQAHDVANPLIYTCRFSAISRNRTLILLPSPPPTILAYNVDTASTKVSTFLLVFSSTFSPSSNNAWRSPPSG